MRTVGDIYKEYKIMPTLQMHMLRVAAVATLICEAITLEVDRENIILAELFHDMGNLIKTKMDVFPEFFKPEGVEYWQGVKNELIAKYGSDEHHAALAIMKELGLPSRAIVLADSNKFSQLCSHLKSSDFEVKITHYADGRVGPHGILSYQERMAEAAQRYKGRNHIFPEANREELVACGLEIEKEIFKHCKIKPEDITDETVAPIIEQLKGLMVKS